MKSEPDLAPVLRRRAASWCLRHDLPEEALEYSIAAADVGMAAGLVVAAETLAERSLVAMARGDWDRAEDLAGQARTVLRQAGIEESRIAGPCIKPISPGRGDEAPPW